MRRLAALGTVVILAGCGGGDQPELERTTLLVSGRDEHGLLAHPSVGLREKPDGPRVASVRDGTIVRVVEARGEWLGVRALEGGKAEGWVNDYYLRGTVHVVARSGCAVGSLAPNVQAELLGVATRGGREWVQVRTVITATVAWVERAAIRELSNPAC